MSHPAHVDVLIDSQLTLPSLSAIVFRLNELLSARLPSMGEVGELVSEDPALAAQVLKLVNSPLHHFHGRIDSIQRAVTLIGVRELRNLALAASVTKAFAGIPEDIVDMEAFWRHSVFTALLARGIAEAAGQKELDRYFVCGLLHDLGMLAVFQGLPEHARRAIEHSERTHVPLAQAERELMGFDHSEVGERLMRHWALPDNIIAAVAGHHEREPQGAHRMAAAIVRLADLIANDTDEGRIGVGHREGVGISDWEQAGLRDHLRANLVGTALSRFESARQILVSAA